MFLGPPHLNNTVVIGHVPLANQYEELVWAASTNYQPPPEFSRYYVDALRSYSPVCAKPRHDNVVVKGHTLSANQRGSSDECYLDPQPTSLLGFVILL